MNPPVIDVPTLIDWLGAEGARAGLRSSKKASIAVLRDLAAHYGIGVPPKAKKNTLIDLLVLHFSRTITKTFEEMKSMTSSQLFEYLDSTACSKEEVQELLSNFGFSFKRNDSRVGLIRHAASLISDLGMFQRIAGEGEFK